MNSPKGFTLIELLVVIAIIALLMGILMPALRAAREQGNKAVCLSHAKSLITAIHAYAADYDDEVPSSVSYHNASRSFVAWVGFTKPPRFVGLGRLYATGIIKNPDIFYCPAQKNPALKRERQGEEGSGWTWEAPTGTGKAISYHYGLLSEIRSAPELQLKSSKLSTLKDRVLISDAFMPFEQGAVWAHPKGLTAGFAAGHIEFRQIDKEVIDLAAAMDTREVDTRDLFTAAMFELLRGRTQIMDQIFFGRNSDGL